MRLVTPQLIVEENDSFKNDALDRKGYGEALLNVITKSNDELVISLDGKWGEGKTTFVKMWQGLLSEADIPNIYIDAFSNDYLDDAFISVASAITNYTEEHIHKDHHDKLEELMEKTKNVGGQLISWSTKIGIKAATLGIIKDAELDELKNIKGDIAKSTSNLVSKLVEDRITSHSKDIELIQSFRDILSQLPQNLTDNGDKSLVIIIDELDRCKPTYAVDIIEKVKHLFSVKNVVFVLVMNKSQLEESIKSVYGQNIDAHSYLQKFINFEAKIPKRTKEHYINDLNTYASRLLELHELETWGDSRNIIECLEPFSNHFNISLRQLERVFTNLAVFYATSAENQLRLVPIIVFLAVVKVVAPRLFDDLLHQRVNYNEMTDQLKLTNLNDENERNRKLLWSMEWIRYALLSEQEFNGLPEEDEIKGFGRSLWNYNVDRESLIPIFSKNLAMFEVR